MLRPFHAVHFIQLTHSTICCEFDFIELIHCIICDIYGFRLMPTAALLTRPLHWPVCISLLYCICLHIFHLVAACLPACMPVPHCCVPCSQLPGEPLLLLCLGVAAVDAAIQRGVGEPSALLLRGFAALHSYAAARGTELGECCQPRRPLHAQHWLH
jgi:hypothetical protein